MSDEKWEKLPYLLATPSGVRSLVLRSNFEPTENGWFDTGQYTVTEGGITLGDIYVDLYTDGGISWDGKPGEFSEEQLNAIVDHIVFRNIPELEDKAEDCNPQSSSDYRIYNDIPTEDTALLVIKNGDKTMMVSVKPEGTGYSIKIDSEPVATIVRANEGWNSQSGIADDLLNFIIDYLDDQGRL
jgi:hypothetical protein